MKLLLTGDIHIGRRPGGLPAGIDGSQYSASAVWAAVVEKAIEEEVSVVLLSGDVVDRDNRMCEAFGPLERGLRKLGDAGIQTVAVSGNHDFDVLPALTSALPGDCFRLLGQKGKWERFPLKRDGQTVLYLDGWSYPKKEVPFNPLTSYDFGVPDDAPALGLLHTDIYSTDHAYAPVSREQLRTTPPRFWLLGHIHGAHLEQSPVSNILYPGTPQAVSRKDSGPHGVYIGELGAGGNLEPVLHIISQVQYHPLDVDLGGAEDTEDVRARVINVVNDALGVAADENVNLRHLLFQVKLTGRCRILGELDASIQQLKNELQVSAGDATGSIERISVQARPDHDLAELSRETETSAVGVLADLIISLEGESLPEKYAGLIEDAKRNMTVASGKAVYAALAHSDTSAVKEHIQQQAMRLLDALIAQREGVSP